MMKKIFYVFMVLFLWLGTGTNSLYGQNALNFDGTNDFVNCGNAASLQLSTGTIEAWVKTSNAGTGFRGIVVKNSAYGLFMNDNVLIGYSWGSTGIMTTNISLNDNAWHHVAMSFQSGVTNGTRIYIDGVLRATSLLTVQAQTMGLSLGAGSTGGGQNFTGDIEDVRIWSTVRTATEIANNRTCELVGTETGLVSYYKMNQGTAGGTNTGITTLTDTKNANNGTLTNFALTGSTSNWVTSTALSRVSIAASATSITYGTSVTFTATASGGTSPTYQWKRNGTNVGTNSNTYTDATLDNNDIITCVVTSTSACGTSLTATSNSITMTITTPQANVLNFDGTDDYVNCGNPASLQLNTGTIEAWIKTSDAGVGFRGIISKRQAFGLFLNNNTLIGYSWEAVGVILNTGVTLNDNQWHHVAMSFQSGVANGTNIYIDGVLVTTAQLNVSSHSNDLTIGSGSTISQYFTGNIEEARIWNTVRTATEIANNRSCDLAGNESGLVAYYKMNQASASGTNTSRTTLTDKTGNGNSGTLTNFALTGTTSNWISIVSVAASATNITSGTSVTFTATPNIGTSPTYQWQKNGANVGTNSATYTNAALINGDVITCIVTSTSTCGTSLSATSNSVTMTVTPTASNALNFDGVDDYITLPNIDPISSGTAGQYTVETWVRLNAYTSGLGCWIYGDEAGNNGGIIMQIDGAGYIWTYRQATGIVTSTAQVPLNTWTHIAFVQDASNLKLYVNGVFIQNLLSGANLNLEATNSPTVGGLTTSRFLNGTLDEMRIWNVARTATQIADTYTCQATGSESGLLAYYRFNQGLAAGANTGLITLADVTANANNGTLSNFALTGTTSNWVTGNTFNALTPAVTVAPNTTTTIAAGTSVTFTATLTNGGATPSYQWKKNGNDVGTNSATYTDAALVNNDAITCVITSSSACVALTTATSNSVTMTVVAPTPNALHFDGTNDYVAVPDASSLDLTNAFTLESWVYPTAYATTADPTYGIQGFIGKNRNNAGGIGYFFGMISGNLTVLLNNNVTNVGASSTTLVPLNTWSHVAATYDGTTIRMYLNGTQVFTQALSGFSCANSTQPLYIGGTGTAGTSTWLFKGNMDEARVWNTARSASQIANNYNCQLAGSESGLVAYYKFNQGVAAGTNTGLTTLTDATANGNNGTLTNFALTGTTSNWVSSSVSTSVTPSVSIAANPVGTITSGTSVTFTATPTNGGAAPSYQWKKNGNNVGTNNATYTDAALVNNDVIACVMTSSVTCANTATANSNNITMTVNAVLPIELLKLEGKTSALGNLLTWQTAEETNASHFDIEKSLDSKNFYKIGAVKTKGNHTNYEFLDDKNKANLSYYRLKMNDLDTKFSYSKTISILREGKGKVKIYPSVTADNIVVEGAKSLEIVNSLGQVVIKQIQLSNSTISLQSLPSGIYFVRGEATEGGYFVEKIIKE